MLPNRRVQVRVELDRKECLKFFLHLLVASSPRRCAHSLPSFVRSFARSFVPELVRVDQNSAFIRWSPAGVSLVGAADEVGQYDDANVVTSFLVQMQRVRDADFVGGDGAPGEGYGTDGTDGTDGRVLGDGQASRYRQSVSEGAWCTQYWGSETGLEVKGLRPGRCYAACVQCHPSVKDGAADVELQAPSEAVLFRTSASVPSAMLPPVMMEKGRTSLKLQLAEPEEHGGYPVTEYVVEGTGIGGVSSRDGSVPLEGAMREIYRGLGTSFVWDGLSPGMRYTVRAKAVNRAGAGAFSSTASFLTQCAPPDPPSGILCMPNGQDMITLQWEKPRGNGLDVSAYVVELGEADRSGSRSAWREVARVQTCSLALAKLRRGEEYRMRVCAENAEGRSAWSRGARYVVGGAIVCGSSGSGETSAYSSGELRNTASNASISASTRPGTPKNLRHERRKNSSVFLWDPTGPAVADQTFILEISEVDESKSAAHIWKVRYKSEEPRHEIHTLKSDLKYQVSVKACVNNANDSSYCKTILVDMEELTGKVKVPATPDDFTYVDGSRGAKLAWHLDPRDAADCIFELYVADTEDLSHKKNYVRKNAFTLLYRGEEMSYAIGDELVVGKHYTARVRSMRSGKTSEWSRDVAFERKPSGGSGKIAQLRVVDVHSTSASLEWALVLADEDRAQTATTAARDGISYAISLEVVDDGFHHDGSNERIVQTGVRDKHTVVDMLQPDSEYLVRVRATNRGTAHGPWSEPITIATAPAPLNPPELFVESKSQNDIVLSWTLPKDRKGRDVITSIHLQETKLGHFEKSAPRKSTLAPCSRFIATGLTVGSLYGFRIRLETVDGLGPWSRMLQVETEPGPPDKPHVPTTAPSGMGNAFKVNWRHPHDNGSSITDFELSLSRAGQADRIVYQGPDLTTRVQNLEFGTKYSVCVRASNSCGHGPWSDRAEIATLVKPPEPPERVSARIEDNHVLISWGHSRSSSSTPCVGYDIEVKGHSGDKYRSHHKSSMAVVARKTCNASLTSCTIPQPACSGEILIRIRSIGGQGSGHGPWSSPCVVVNPVPSPRGEAGGKLARTTSPTSKQMQAYTPEEMAAVHKSFNQAVAEGAFKEQDVDPMQKWLGIEPGSPGSSSKKYKRKAFQKTATAKIPRARFSLASLYQGTRFTPVGIFCGFFLCLMLMALYQTTMDIGNFGKPMRPTNRTYESTPRLQPSKAPG